MTEYCSLHNHTYYSLLSALSSPKELFLRAKQLNQKAIAISDYGTLSGVWDCYKLSKEIGIKFIPGCEFYFTNSVLSKEEKLRNIVFLASNEKGYQNLLALHRHAFDNHSLILKKVIPVIDWKLIEKYQDGLICLTGCGTGIVGYLLNQGKFQEAENTLLKLKDIFGNRLCAEVQAHNLNVNATDLRGRINQIFTNQHTINLAQKHQIRIVPTSNSHYVTKEDAETNDVQLAIGSMRPVYSNNRTKFNVPDLYLKSGDEIKTFFTRNYGAEFAEKICSNTIEVMEMCEESVWVNPAFSSGGKKELPVFSVKEQPDYIDFQKWHALQSTECQKLDLDHAYLRYRCSLEFLKKVPKGKEKEYQERLDKELDTFIHCGVSSYMLIVADYIEWSRKNGVAIGTGRGSVGGSMVCYLLGIHLADPIKYGLVFERFYNKKRSGFSDIDCDFSKTNRFLVEEYLAKKYGKDHVSRVTNINTITPKVFARDLSRALQLGGTSSVAVQVGNMTADFIPKDAKNIDDALKSSPLFTEVCKRYPDFVKYKKICSTPRAASIHAAAVIINSRPISSILPIRLDKEGKAVVELDKDKSEEAGLVKMDLLGLETLDIISLTHQLIKEQGKTVPVINYDQYDEKTYNLISSGQTLGVFQFGISAGTIDLCRKIKPRTIDDLAIITTLARPSSKDIREDFIKTRSGKMQTKLLHPSLQRAMAETFGFSIYDESLLSVANDVAGWDLAEADKLRKLTKEKGKNPERAKKWKEEFIEGAIKNKIPEDIAIRIWVEIVEPYAKYSFCKAHAVLYSMISYETAFLKAHFPLEFLLANLKFELASNAPVAEENASKIKAELRKIGNNILPPNVNSSEISYKIQDNTTLLTGFEAIKFLGDEAMNEILAQRPFTSFYDFMAKTTTKNMRATAIQALAASGALDCFKIPRKVLYLYSADYRKKLQVWTKKSKTEQFEYEFPEMEEWTKEELYALEKHYLGEAFICGKAEAYSRFFQGPSISYKDIFKMKNKEFLSSVRGEIKSVLPLKIKKETSRYVGQDMLKCVLEDEFNNQINITFFPDSLKEAQKLIKVKSKNNFQLEPGLAIQINGSVNIYQDEVGIAVNELLDFCPAPQLPKDLKKRTNKKSSAKKPIESSIKSKPDTVEDFISDLEDTLYLEGFLDLEKEED